jgi:hypothetical protein
MCMIPFIILCMISIHLSSLAFQASWEVFQGPAASSVINSKGRALFYFHLICQGIVAICVIVALRRRFLQVIQSLSSRLKQLQCNLQYRQQIPPVLNKSTL